jgi:excisionase family DNA binding protein
MRATGQKEVLTTGEVALICRVAPRTVSKWVDSGKLRGYRIPGSRDRRIPLPQLIAFMRAHDIPLDGLDQGVCRIIVLSTDTPHELARQVNQAGRYDLRVAHNEFQAGMIAQQFRPHVVVVDLPDNQQEALAVCRTIKNADGMEAAKVLAVTGANGPGTNAAGRQWAAMRAFDGFLARPVSAGSLLAAVEEATNFLT